jgi:hypothetical protein
MYYYILFVYSTIFLVSKVNSYGSGAPPNFCDYTSLEGRNVVLRPGHNAQPQNNVKQANYQIEARPFNGQSVRGKL